MQNSLSSQQMSDDLSLTAKAVDRDGNNVEFKRPGKIRMFVNGQEMNNSQYQEALAEVAGMNNGKAFTETAKLANGALEQAKLQSVRTIVNTAWSTPTRIVKEGGQKNAALLSQLLSMLFSTISRTSQSIGR